LLKVAVTIDNKAFQDIDDRTPAANTGLAKVAVQCFVGQFLLYLNFGASYESWCVKSPPSPSPKPLPAMPNGSSFQIQSMTISK